MKKKHLVLQVTKKVRYQNYQLSDRQQQYCLAIIIEKNLLKHLLQTDTNSIFTCKIEV